MDNPERFTDQVDQYDAWQRETIRTYGWAVQAVIGDGECPSFVYTVGLSGFAHAELILFAASQATAATVLNDLGELVRSGRSLTAGEAVRLRSGTVHLLAFPDSADRLLGANQLYRSPGGPPVPALLVVPEDGLVETPGEDRPCSCAGALLAGRAGPGAPPTYEVELVAAAPGPVLAEAGCTWSPRDRCPSAVPSARCWCPGVRARAGPTRRSSTGSGTRRPGPTVWCRSAPGRSCWPRPGCSTGTRLPRTGGSPPGRPRPTRRRRPPRSDLHPVRTDLDRGRGDRRKGPRARTRGGRPRCRGGAAHRPGPGDVRPPGRRTEPVRRPGVVPPAPRPSMRAAQDLIHTEPTSDLRGSGAGRRVGMSARHFSREFSRPVGTPPGDYSNGSAPRPPAACWSPGPSPPRPRPAGPGSAPPRRCDGPSGAGSVSRPTTTAAVSPPPAP